MVVQHILNAQGAITKFKDNKPGDTWFRGFMKRHPSLKQRKTCVLDNPRAMVTQDKTLGWFREMEKKLLEEGVDIKSVPPSQIWNCDETGFQLHGQINVIICDRMLKHPYEVNAEKSENITVIVCASVGGEILPPHILYPGRSQEFKFQPHPKMAFPGCKPSRTPNGWVTKDSCYYFMKNIFVPATRDLPRPVILFVDGHTTHVTEEIHKLCADEQIIYYILPAHASHIIQPLDLVYYQNLKAAWKKVMRDHRFIGSMGQISRIQFALLFREAWGDAYSIKKLKSSFRESGLSPYNPYAINFQQCIPGETLLLNYEDRLWGW